MATQLRVYIRPCACQTQKSLNLTSWHPISYRAFRGHRRGMLLVQAGPPTGAFDEAPTEPVGTQQRQISAELMRSMKAKISEALDSEDVSVVDQYGNSQHVSIRVVSPAFEGKTPVQRQRMVYKAIWMELQDTVHAVDEMKTLTPGEAGSQ